MKGGWFTRFTLWQSNLTRSGNACCSWHLTQQWTNLHCGLSSQCVPMISMWDGQVKPPGQGDTGYQWSNKVSDSRFILLLVDSDLHFLVLNYPLNPFGRYIILSRSRMMVHAGTWWQNGSINVYLKNVWNHSHKDATPLDQSKWQLEYRWKWHDPTPSNSWCSRRFLSILEFRTVTSPRVSPRAPGPDRSRRCGPSCRPQQWPIDSGSKRLLERSLRPPPALGLRWTPGGSAPCHTCEADSEASQLQGQLQTRTMKTRAKCANPTYNDTPCTTKSRKKNSCSFVFLDWKYPFPLFPNVESSYVCWEFIWVLRVHMSSYLQAG